MAAKQIEASHKINAAHNFLIFNLPRLKSKNAKIMLDKIFTGPVVLIRRV